MNILKHHADQLVNMASTNALASEFIEEMPKSVAMGIASTTMTEELKAVANKHGISFSGHGAALIGKAAFPTPEDRAEFEREVMPVLALKTLLESTEGASGSFEA